MALERVRRLLVEVAYDVDEKSFNDAKAKTDELKKGLRDLGNAGRNLGKGFGRGARGATDAVGKLREGISNLDDRINSAIGNFVALGAAAGGAFVGKAISASIQAENLNARLLTVTGSADKASATMERLSKFTAGNSLVAAEAADAFIKLSNLGLDPSERALQSYGNTSAALGKDLDQLIEAVADASVGEFERLKEFGIKASVSGNKVAFTFRGQTTKIKKDADEIQKFLIGLGEQNFGDAMANQVNTLGNQLKKARERAENFLVAVGEAGLTAAVKRLNDRMTELSGGSGELADRIGVWLGEAVDKLINAINWAIENTATLKAIVVALGVAFAGLKVARFAGEIIAIGQGAAQAGQFIWGLVASVRSASGALQLIGAVASPVLIKIAAIGAAVVVFVDVMRFLTGNGGLIQDFVDRFASADGILGQFARALKSAQTELRPFVKELLSELVIAGKDIADDVLPVLLGIGVAIIDLGKTIAPFIVDWIKRFLQVQSTMRAVLMPIIRLIIDVGLKIFKLKVTITAFAIKVAAVLFKFSRIFLKFFLPIEDVFKKLVLVFDQVKAAGRRLGEALAPVFEKITALGGKIFDRVEQAFEKFLATIRKIIRKVASVVDLPREVLEFAGIGIGRETPGTTAIAERGARIGTGQARAATAAEELLRIRAQRNAVNAQIAAVNINLEGKVADTAALVDRGKEFGREVAGGLEDELRNFFPAEG